jgi:CheY-like chemotaxis protein
VQSERVLVIDDSPTILKVVELVLTKAGFAVQTALDGEEGIKRAMEQRPSLILLDFVMPKLNGYQVCRALSDSMDLKDVPVVLMSAKGDQVGERFVKVMGIVDYITKPFSPEAITAVVQHTISKYGRKNGEPSGLLPIAQETEPEKEATMPRMAGLGEAERRMDALAQLRESLIEALSPDDGDTDEKGEIADYLDSALHEKLDDATLEALVQPVARELSDEGEVALQGNVQRVPIAEVLGLLSQQRQWGVLRVTRTNDGEDPRRAVAVYFKQGRVELSLAEGLAEEFLVGRYLVDSQAISRQDLELFLQSREGGAQPHTLPGPLGHDRAKAPKPIGEQLLKLNYVTEADLKQALRRQTQESIYELLRWPAGRFAFIATRELDPLALDAALGLDVDGILMEGFRRVDEWHLIEREIDDFDEVYLRNEEAVQNVGKARLTREELQVLDLVNGKNTVKDVVRQSRMGSFEVSKMLFRLLSIKLIRRRVAPVAV